MENEQNGVTVTGTVELQAYDAMTSDRDTYRKRADKAEQALGVKQAEIDRLMLEHCPDEMSAEQMATWEASQRVAAPQQHAYRYIRPDEICIVGCPHDGKTQRIDMPIVGDGTKDGKRLFLVALPDSQQHVQAAVVPEGWALVPVKPTDAMLASLEHPDAAMARIYRAMLAAAPSPAMPVDPGVYRVGADGSMDRLCEVCGNSKSDGHGCFCGGPETVKYGKPPTYEALKMEHDFDDAPAMPADGDGAQSEASELQIDAAIQKLRDLDANIWSRSGLDLRYVIGKILTAAIRALSKQEPTA